MMKRDFIATYHHGFAGGSKNASRFLHYLSKEGNNVEAYFLEVPQFFTYTESTVKLHRLGSGNIHSEVIDSDILRHYSASESIVRDLGERTDLILFGVNLFPYCNILHDAKAQILESSRKRAKLVIHPVGSDIWQIGPQIKTRVKWLLESPNVDYVFTYSMQFADEIRQYYDVAREIQILPPVVEKERFYPLNAREILSRRNAVGFNEDDFIIHHHSSMRRVKCPGIILDVAMKTSQLLNRQTVLIMTGPIPWDIIRNLNLSVDDLRGTQTMFKYRSSVDNLKIYWTDVSPRVEYLLQISDVELNTSLHDSFNISLMEGMACGIPVVTSDVVGIRGHSETSDAGVCFPTKKLKFDELNKTISSDKSQKDLFDVDYAVDATIEIARNMERWKKNGANGAKYVTDNFAFEKVAAEFYRNLE